VQVDRAAGTLVIDDVQVLKNQERTRTIALADVRGLTVRSRYAPPSGQRATPVDVGHPRQVEAIVAGEATADGRVLRLEVLGIDSGEKVADLAYRLGAAMGLRHQRVVHSDPRHMEIEMQAEAAPGLEALPVPERGSDYVGGRVSAGATRAAAEPRIARFDPSAWPSPSRLTRWAPGDEVVFDKPREGWAVGCLPFALGGLALGPFTWWLSEHDLAPTVGTTAFGLFAAALAFAFIAASLPRHVRVAWAEQEMTIKAGMTRRRVRLDRIAGLELRCVRQYYSARKGKRSYNAYHCRVMADLRGETTTAKETVELVATKSFEDRPETPYEAALPLTKALADALAVPWRVTDYT
jgi:hypothetical protein